MNKLWTYGCSWTYSRPHEEDLGIIFWPSFVAEELNLDLKNRAYGGLGDSSIQRLISDLPKINKGDIVIFQFSYSNRLDLPYLNNDGDVWNSCYIEMNSLERNEKQIKYMDFVMAYDTELLLKNFQYVSLIFDYLEKIIGVIVRYWFLHLSANYENFIKRKITTNRNRNIVFFSEHNDLFAYAANNFINDNKLRISDYNYNRSDLEYLRYDSHPNQDGQQLIAKCVIDSFKKKLI